MPIAKPVPGKGLVSNPCLRGSDVDMQQLPTGALNVYGEPGPHESLAYTVILAAVLPVVYVILLVVLLPLQPVPVATQVYDVAPATGGTV